MMEGTGVKYIALRARRTPASRASGPSATMAIVSASLASKVSATCSGSLMPLPQVVPYGSSKAALNAMSRSLAWEYAPHVRVNTLSPGAFRTDIVEAWPDKGQGPIAIPRGHAADPPDIVTAALFLASPASVNVTGSLVRCDGGQH